MFANTYRFASEPLPFSWNETQYNSIADWQTATGLDLDARIVIEPFEVPSELELLKTQPLTRDIFDRLIPGCEDSLQ
jgi:hypothetical protein